MGQWKPYSCVEQTITATQTVGTTSEANTPTFRATSDDNEGAVYQVIFTAGAGANYDTFYYKKSIDGGVSYTSYYAAPSGTDLLRHSVSGTVFHSFDKGVEMSIPNGSNLITTDTWQFTVPALEKRYDGGIHAFIAIPYIAGTTEGQGIIYSEDIPFAFDSGFSMFSNARNLTYIHKNGSHLGNSGTSVDLQWTVNGTDYIQGFELSDDADWGGGAGTDRGNIVIYDKGDASGTRPLETGGDTLKYRLKLQFEEEAGGEKILHYRQYGHYAIYKN